MNAIQYQLKRLGASKSVLKWAQTHDNPNDAWFACPRGDWLLCLAVKLGVEHRVVVRVACTCARLALPFSQDQRPLRAMLLAEDLAARTGDVTVEDVKAAAKECDDAAVDALSHGNQAGANVALAGMYAAIAALPGKTPQGAAGAAAEAAAEAAGEVGATLAERDAARTFVHQACANIVRSKIDEAIIMRLWWRHARQP